MGSVPIFYGGSNMSFVIQFFSYVGLGFGISMMVAGIYCFVKNEMLYRWLKVYKYERWREITTAETRFGRIGPGIVNTKKHWEYLYSETDNNDENILRLKDSIKIGLRYVGIFLMAFLVTMGIVVILIFQTSKG